MLRAVPLLFGAALAAAAPVSETPGAHLAAKLKKDFVAADVLTPVDLAYWEAAVAEWTSDPAWEGAKEAAGGLSALRRGLTGPDPAAVEDGVRTLADAFDIRQPGDDALAARYEALRASLAGAGVTLEPETERFRGADGAPLDSDDWRVHLEKLPLEVRRRLFTVFGAACGIGERPPTDPLAYVPKKKAPPKPVAVAKAPPPKKAAAPKPKALAPVIKEPTPKERAAAKELADLRAVLQSAGLVGKMAESEKVEVLKAWEKALDGAVSDEGKTDYGLAVNGLRELTAKGSTVAARWGFASAAAYNLGSDLGPKAAMAAAFAEKGTAVLYAKAMQLAGAGAGDGRSLTAAVKDGSAREFAATQWAGALPNPKKSAPIDGTVKTFKLEGTVNKFRGYFGL